MTERSNWEEIKGRRADSPQRRKGYEAAKTAFEWGSASAPNENVSGSPKPSSQIGSARPSPRWPASKPAG